MVIQQSKKAQAEIITTVLLILIGIAAVVLVAGFVINMVRSNLQETDCFKTTGELTISLDSTYFDSANNYLYVGVQRGSKDFNLTGIVFTFGTSTSSKSVTIKEGDAGNIANGSALVDNSFAPITGVISLPKQTEKSTFVINTNKSGISSVTTVSIVPVLKDNVRCDKADEKEVKSQ